MPDETASSAATTRWHLPEIARLANGMFGVFCQACSYDKGDYVYPCPGWTDATERPPGTLVAADRYEGLRERVSSGDSGTSSCFAGSCVSSLWSSTG